MTHRNVINQTSSDNGSPLNQESTGGKNEGSGAHPSGKESFAKMFSSVIKDQRITDKDFRILAFIKSYSSNWRAYQSHIARELGVSASTVARSIKRLDAAGYLTYEVKQTKVGLERRNLQMRHRPTHWNDTRAKPKRSKAHQTKWRINTPGGARHEEDGQSNLTATPIKSDSLGLSDLTHNEESKNTKYEDSETESYDFVTDGALPREVISQLWMAYNSVPEGFVPFDTELAKELFPTEYFRLCDESSQVWAGLQLKPDQRNEYDCDAGVYVRDVKSRMRKLDKGNPFPLRLFVKKTNEGFAVFINSDYL